MRRAQRVGKIGDERGRIIVHGVGMFVRPPPDAVGSHASAPVYGVTKPGAWFAPLRLLESRLPLRSHAQIKGKIGDVPQAFAADQSLQNRLRFIVVQRCCGGNQFGKGEVIDGVDIASTERK